MTTSLAIDARDVVRRYGTREVLRRVHLQVHQGELLGLIGPNGAGKSTLLRSLIGLVRPDSGPIAVLGFDPARDAVAIRQRCCYLPGETSVYHQMTGEQFLRFALSFYPRRQPALQQQLVDGFGLPMRQRIRSYSAGMKQKLALIATLVPDVDLYLLDEPDRALDASVRFFLRDVLLQLKRLGKTIVLSSHHLSEVENLCDRLEFLVGGRIVPASEVGAARERLSRRLRLRLREGTALPASARLVEQDGDGTLVVDAGQDPLVVLQQLAPGALLSAEVGMVRLEDLYRLLLREPAEAVRS